MSAIISNSASTREGLSYVVHEIFPQVRHFETPIRPSCETVEVGDSGCERGVVTHCVWGKAAAVLDAPADWYWILGVDASILVNRGLAGGVSPGAG